MIKESESILSMKTGKIGYNAQNDRYGLLISDLWEHDGFHCGETMEVEVNGEWTRTRMEMNMKHQWYLVGTPYVGNLENIKARI